MKVYTLTIVYNDEKEEVEYLTEELQADEGEFIQNSGIVELEGYFDEDDLRIISGSYIIGEA